MHSEGDRMSATEMQAWAAAAARSESLTKIYGEGDAAVRALDAVTVAFRAGHFTAIMGPSGSGKSTLLHCLAGLDTPSSGRVLIGDVDLTTLSEKELTLLRREKVGFVFQAYNLIPTLTAAENITLPLDIAGDKPDRSWFDQVVDAVGLRDRLHHRPSELSGGQAQRVGGARGAGRRPSAREPPRDRLRRRTDGEPRLTVRRRAPHVPAERGEGSWTDDRHGHPRRERGEPRGSDRVPRGRPRRRRDARAHHRPPPGRPENTVVATRWG